MASVLAAIRAAMHGDAETHSPDGDETGASAPDATGSPSRADEKGTVMSKEQDKPAAEAGISKAEHDAAVTGAETKGHTAGVKAGTDRLTTALGADGVKGDSGRMAAALDLAVKSPAMSGEDVAAFVVANVAAAPSGDATYEQKRLAGAALARPVGETAPAAGAGWSKTAEQINKRRN